MFVVLLKKIPYRRRLTPILQGIMIDVAIKYDGSIAAKSAIEAVFTRRFCVCVCVCVCASIVPSISSFLYIILIMIYI